MLDAAGLGLQAEGHWLWRKLDLQIAAGTRLGIRGRSGSGKSSLLRCLAGLIGAEEGTISYRGQTLAEWYMPAYRAEVMYLPADPLVQRGTVLDNLRSPFALASHAGHCFDLQQAHLLLGQLGRNEQFAQRRTDKLSSGERQVLALTRALLLEPVLLLLDEATASLDPASEQQAEKVLEQWLQERPGRGWVMVSHSDDQLQRMSSQQLDLSAR